MNHPRHAHEEDNNIVFIGGEPPQSNNFLLIITLPQETKELINRIRRQ